MVLESIHSCTGDALETLTGDALETQTGNALETQTSFSDYLFVTSSEEDVDEERVDIDDVPAMLWQEGRRDPEWRPSGKGPTSLYWQVVLWPGIAVARHKVAEFLTWMRQIFDLKWPVRPIGAVFTPDGTPNFAFVLHQEDVAHRFAQRRRRYDMVWLEEAERTIELSADFKSAYPPLW